MRKERAEGHKDGGEKYQAKGGGGGWGGGWGKGELCRKIGSPHGSDHSKVKVWRGKVVQAHRCCKLSNSFGKDEKEIAKGGSEKCVLIVL